MTDDIILPPLPLPDHAGPNGTGTYFSAWTETQVRDAQRAAILLDRQQRAAPSAGPVITDAMVEAAHGFVRSMLNGASLPDKHMRGLLRAALEAK
jgi:hypothetical protein